MLYNTRCVAYILTNGKRPSIHLCSSSKLAQTLQDLVTYLYIFCWQMELGRKRFTAKGFRESC